MNTPSRITPNILHIRPFDEDGETYPNGGVTVAFHLIAEDGNVVAKCGVAHCSSDDPFKKDVGVRIATIRLANMDRMSEENMRGQRVTVCPIEEVKADLQVWVKTDQGTFTLVPYASVESTYAGEPLLLKESDYAVTEVISYAVVKSVATYRFNTYEGTDEFILDEIDSMMADYLGEDEDDEDEEDLEDLEEDSDDTQQ